MSVTASDPDLKPTPIRPEVPPIPARPTPTGDEQEAGQGSLFVFGTSLLRHRWRILRWTLFFGILAAVLALMKPTVYAATASFIPQGAAASRSNLATLAGQLGVAVPTSTQTLSPEFYVKLLRSRELLKAIVNDTLTVVENGNRRIPFVDLFRIAGDSPKRREDEGIKVLSDKIAASAAKATGVVDFSVETKWPSVSVTIANELVNGVNQFNQRLRQEQASAERKFVEARLAIAAQDLRASEDRLEGFLRGNREFSGSYDLSFQRGRLQRDVDLKQQVYTTLTQAYEDVRIREVRDTPVITVIEQPAVPSVPEPAGKAWTVILGLLLGAFLGSVSGLLSESITRRREAGDVYADEFAGTLGEMKGQMLGGVQRLRQRMRR